MKKGMIYILFDYIVRLLFLLNLVELLKYMAFKFYYQDNYLAGRFATDIFIILKWLIVLIFWHYSISNSLSVVVVWYLIITNIYTYFYYHVWSDDLYNSTFDALRIKRRFMNLLLAIFFNVIAFSYFYAVPYSHYFEINTYKISIMDYIFFSFAKMLTIDYSIFEKIHLFGERIIMVESIISFFFLAIILSNSIPQIKEK